MKWSTGFMAVGAMLCLLSVVPVYLSGITLNTLEGAASLLAIGILVFLVGFLLRKITKTFRKR